MRDKLTVSAELRADAGEVAATTLRTGGSSHGAWDVESWSLGVLGTHCTLLGEGREGEGRGITTLYDHCVILSDQRW